jgi:hypothetical protein
MTLTRASVLFAAVALSACVQAPSVRFGLIRGIDVTETRRIPYVVGTHYGFRVDYRDTGHPITLRERFDLPAPCTFSQLITGTAAHVLKSRRTHTHTTG